MNVIETVAQAIRDTKNRRKGESKTFTENDRLAAEAVVGEGIAVIRTALHDRANQSNLASGLISYIHDEIDNCLDSIVTAEPVRW